MMTVRDIKAWLNTLPDDDSVGVDDGGLTLVPAGQPDAWLEIGGMPEGVSENA
jgi:hypothetical protein